MATIQQNIAKKKEREAISFAKKKTTISWDGKLHDDISKLAAKENRSLSNYMEVHFIAVRDKAVADGLLN